MDNRTNVFQGKYYRITVLTERLVRLEYSTNGIFEDRLTEFVVNRNFEIPQFEVEENGKLLKITTKYFILTYKKDMPFLGNKINPSTNLKVELVSQDKTWYYGHPEIRNYGGIKPSFNSGVKTIKGLYSIDGFASFDDSKSRVLLENGIYTNRENIHIDIYLFMYRNDFELALKDYFLLTGFPVLPPKYAFGVWWSRDYRYKTDELIDLVQNFEENGIPLSVILLDKYWHEFDLDDKTIDTSKYIFNDYLVPSPTDLITYMKQHNVRLGLNVNFDSGIKYTNKFGDDILLTYNVLDEKFIKTLIANVVFTYKGMGINTFWLDYRKNILDINIIDRYLNLTNDFRENRPVVLSRACTIAPHRNCIVYSGRTKVSYETLNKLPYYTSRAANIGVSWISHDIGGYYGGMEDDELYIRYVQLGVFSPILRFHGGTSKYYKKEPWNRSISTQYIVKDYLNLRHRLIPYIYSEGYNYSFNAIPFIKPFYYTNKEVYDEPQYISEYYFGSQMFVSPITVKRDYMIKRVVHKFLLPDGIWYDLRSGRKYIGGKEYVGLYKKEEYPVFVKAGGIIPLNIDKNFDNKDELDIMIFPGRSNNYELYEDDGNTLMYKQGYFIITNINYTYSDNEININLKPIKGVNNVIPTYRKYKFILRNTSLPTQIVCKNNNIDINFEYRLEDNNLIIILSNVNTLTDLNIKLTGNNLELDLLKKYEEDLDLTISDLPIETPLKEKLSSIIFSNNDLKQKRIEIIKLKKLIPKNYYPLILKLLDYMYSDN